MRHLGSCHFIMAPTGDRMICVHAPICTQSIPVRTRDKGRRRERRARKKER